MNGDQVRREVLGDAHVDRSAAAATAFTGPWQDYVGEHAWGAVWTRDGLDRRTRSCITLAVLVTLGHDEELGLHVRAAIGNGVTVAEIREALIHTAVYAGVPATNAAFRVAAAVLAEMGLDA